MKIIKVPKIGDELELLPYESNQKLYAPYIGEIKAGFPSPAADFEGKKLSLDEKYIQNPDNTYMFRVGGNSMYPTLQEDDILIVKSDLELCHNDIAIVSVNNSDYTVKRYHEKKKLLIADNPKHTNIEILEDDIILCKGIVKHIIRDL